MTDYVLMGRMRFTVRVITGGVATAGSLACARYEWEPDQTPARCASVRPPAEALSFTPEQDAAADSGSVRGRMILSSDQRPLRAMSVSLIADQWRTTTTDSLGTFTFTGVMPGTYGLRVHGIGVHPRIDTLHLAHARSAVFDVPLDPMVVDDPCDAVRVGVRKPWWKLW